jgi:hypothetical protein
MVLAVAGCSSTKKAEQFNGLTDMDGQQVTHMHTQTVGLQLLFKRPLMGGTSYGQAVDDLTMAARDDGASQVRVVQSQKKTYWWILPPFSFIVQPVVVDVAADVR